MPLNLLKKIACEEVKGFTPKSFRRRRGPISKCVFRAAIVARRSSGQYRAALAAGLAPPGGAVPQQVWPRDCNGLRRSPRSPRDRPISMASYAAYGPCEGAVLTVRPCVGFARRP
jgi:hypothetical protein